MSERVLVTLTCLHCGGEFLHLRGPGSAPGSCSEECRLARRAAMNTLWHRRRAEQLTQGEQVHARRVDTPVAGRDVPSGCDHQWHKLRYTTSSGVPWQRHRCAICGHMRLREWSGSEEYGEYRSTLQVGTHAGRRRGTEARRHLDSRVDLVL